MSRVKLTIEYDGGPFVGWQRQNNGLSVQEVLEEAITRLNDGNPVLATAAGRTDAGVHARGQVVHTDISSARDSRALREGINFYLKPYPIAVLAAELVPDSFNARLDAVEREYLYIINNRRAPLAIDRGHAWHVPYALNAEAMHEAAQALVGAHDFTSFRAAACQAKSPNKTLDELTVTREGELILIKARARSFLHHQVRNMTGTLSLVGRGRWSRNDVAAALAARNRSAAGPTAPPEGLYFMAVRYPGTTT